ncbi:hypothetical protein M0802_007567 [Mischocyttarus mexicanus]|nr:hypothetical protein M0802_007567 [Mischocyttarus mexicanus]
MVRDVPKRETRGKGVDVLLPRHETANGVLARTANVHVYHLCWGGWHAFPNRCDTEWNGTELNEYYQATTYSHTQQKIP